MKKLFPWMTALAVLVVVFESLYTVVQQSQRGDANFPQIQMAEDAAAALNKGAKPAALASGQVDMSASLAPFIVVYNKNGQAVAGTGRLDGHMPAVPVGILTSSNGKTYSAVTWQPKADVRIASVTVAAKDYYVLSGRSLTEVEKNETKTLQLSLIGLAISALVLGVGFYLRNHRN